MPSLSTAAVSELSIAITCMMLPPFLMKQPTDKNPIGVFIIAFQFRMSGGLERSSQRLSDALLKRTRKPPEGLRLRKQFLSPCFLYQALSCFGMRSPILHTFARARGTIFILSSDVVASLRPHNLHRQLYLAILKCEHTDEWVSHFRNPFFQARAP